jgi:hypothetical protein
MRRWVKGGEDPNHLAAHDRCISPIQEKPDPNCFSRGGGSRARANRDESTKTRFEGGRSKSAQSPAARKGTHQAAEALVPVVSVLLVLAGFANEPISPKDTLGYADAEVAQTIARSPDSATGTPKLIMKTIGLDNTFCFYFWRLKCYKFRGIKCAEVRQ